RIHDLFVEPEGTDTGQEEEKNGRGSRKRRRSRHARQRTVEIEVGGERLHVNPKLIRFPEEDARLTQLAYQRRHPQARARGGAPRPRSRFAPPTRAQIVEQLDREGLLPAITFIFSRAGCDEAVRQCVGSGLGPTTHRRPASSRPAPPKKKRTENGRGNVR